MKFCGFFFKVEIYKIKSEANISTLSNSGLQEYE